MCQTLVSEVIDVGVGHYGEKVTWLQRNTLLTSCFYAVAEVLVQQIWLIGWIVVSCVWFQILAVKICYYWRTLWHTPLRTCFVTSLTCQCQLSPLPSSSWRKMAWCFSRNEAVIGSCENGFPGPAVAHDGPARLRSTVIDWIDFIEACPFNFLYSTQSHHPSVISILKKILFQF